MINLIYKKQKGQAFSTFQLLIAAVVALAILAILIPMISKNINIGGDPIQAAKEKIKSQMDKPGSLVYTDDLKFSSKKEEFITSDTITKGIGIDPKQVVFSTNGYDNHFEITGGNGYILHVKTKELVKYKFGVLCAETGSNLTDLFDSYNLNKLDDAEGYIASFDASDPDTGDPDATTCVIFPSKV